MQACIFVMVAGGLTLALCVRPCGATCWDTKTKFVTKLAFQQLASGPYVIMSLGSKRLLRWMLGWAAYIFVWHAQQHFIDMLH